MMTMITIVTASPECARFTTASNIPCRIISTYNNSGNCYVNGTVVNESSTEVLQNLTWENYTRNCFAWFNISTLGTYTYNGIETGIITIEADSMLSFGFLLIPLALCFFFIYWANSLKDAEDKQGQHEPLRWFMRFLALLMIFVVYGVANLLIGQNPSFSYLEPLFNIWIYGWIFYTIMGVFLLYFIWKIISSIQEKKKDDFDRGVL